MNNVQEIKNNTEEILHVLAWQMYNLPRTIDSSYLYHYYRGRDVLRVLRDDAIVFRLASLSTFEDKMEGKSVEVYYDLALQELLRDHRISQTEYEELSDISIPVYISA